MKLLRELQEMPDNQAYLCRDAEVAAKHEIAVPFRCGCRCWRGGGLVCIRFKSGLPSMFPGNPYQESDMVLLTTLEPIPGGVWEFDD